MNKLHIPTEQYGFLEVEFDGSPEDAFAEYSRLTSIIKGGTGMDTKDFNKVVDELMSKNSISGDPGMVELMNAEQVMIIQAIKRSRARTNK